MARSVGSIFEAGNAVCFDLDNTLIDRDLACDRFFAYILSTYFPNLDPATADWSDRLESMRKLDQGGRGSKAVIYDNSLGHASGLSAESFVALMRCKLSDYTTWLDGAEQLLKCLRIRKHPMALVTNGSKSQREKIDAIKASSYFDEILISEEVGIAKPDPRVFQMAMSKLDATPDQSVFIGDSLEHDVSGARNAGMMTVYCNRSAKDEIDESLCDLVVTDMGELLDLVTDLDT